MWPEEEAAIDPFAPGASGESIANCFCLNSSSLALWGLPLTIACLISAIWPSVRTTPEICCSSQPACLTFPFPCESAFSLRGATRKHSAGSHALRQGGRVSSNTFLALGPYWSTFFHSLKLLITPGLHYKIPVFSDPASGKS